MTDPLHAAYASARVLVTGHTGFCGAWLSASLLRLGARVYGLALPPEPFQPLSEAFDLSARLTGEHLGDLREPSVVREAVAAADPQVVFHLAARALVQDGLDDPATTLAVNVEGTRHLLDALAGLSRPVTVVVVTTDKVYARRPGDPPSLEDDPLGGEDPYSASKVTVEEMIARMRPESTRLRLFTARAGNIVGPGDRAPGRLLPDCRRALLAGEPLSLRAPRAVRPWQYIADAVQGYLLLGARGAQTEAGAFNFGPHGSDALAVEEAARCYYEAWPAPSGWQAFAGEPPRAHAGTLLLDTAKARALLGWQPDRSPREAIARTAVLERRWASGEGPRSLLEEELEAFGQKTN